MKIFWSWQSDINAKISRSFIRNCIEKSIAELSLELDLEERIEIDHDTKDVLGTPSIIDTIFEKISHSELFIADVTPIAANEKKKVMNPNVAIETGYAFSELSGEKIMTIMNVQFGSIDDLPFDLKHRRGPITYSLDDSSTNEEIKKEEEKLTKQLKKILSLYLDNRQVTSSKALDLDLYGKAKFYDGSNSIFRLDTGGWNDKSEEIYVSESSSYIYFKIRPLTPTTLSKIELKENMNKDNNLPIRPICSRVSNTPISNKYGALVPGRINENLVEDFTQFFKNGNVVGISNAFLSSDNSIPLFVFNKKLKKAVIDSLELLVKIYKEKSQISKFSVEIGIVNNDECTIIRPGLIDKKRKYVDTKLGPLEEELYLNSKIINTEIDIVLQMDELFEKLISKLMDDIAIPFIYEDHKW
jgi:hypothetical protein